VLISRTPPISNDNSNVFPDSSAQQQAAASGSAVRRMLATPGMGAAIAQMKSGCKPFKILQHAAAVLFGCIVRQHAAGS
jgi:hypothetical protein